MKALRLKITVEPEHGSRVSGLMALVPSRARKENYITLPIY
jgi:hypothetical protein